MAFNKLNSIIGVSLSTPHHSPFLPVFNFFREGTWQFVKNYRLLLGVNLRLRDRVGVGHILPTPAPTPIQPERSTPTDASSGCDSDSAALVGDKYVLIALPKTV